MTLENKINILSKKILVTLMLNMGVFILTYIYYSNPPEGFFLIYHIIITLITLTLIYIITFIHSLFYESLQSKAIIIFLDMACIFLVGAYRTIIELFEGVTRISRVIYYNSRFTLLVYIIPALLIIGLSYLIGKASKGVRK